MWKWTRFEIWRVLAVIALLSLGTAMLAVSVSSTNYRPHAYERTTGAKGETDGEAPARESVGAAHCNECAKQAGEQEPKLLNLGPDWYVAIFTALLFGATVFLFAATFGLYKITAMAVKTATEDATRAYLAAHRPRVRVRRIDSADVRGGRASATLHAANVGDTEAIIFEVGIDIVPRERGFMPRFNAVAQAIPSGEVVVPPGAEAVINVLGGHALTPQEINANRTGAREIIAIGLVSYRDSAGVIRHTGFFRPFEWRSNRFLRQSGEPMDQIGAEWEYED